MFPLPAHASFAETIMLRVFAKLGEPSVAKVVVRSVAATNWNEINLTWRTRPTHKETVGALTVAGVSGAWYEVDLTAYAKTQLGEGKAMMVLALAPGDDSRNSVLIEARESQSMGPALVFRRKLVAARISFCPATAATPEGYFPDHGHVFGTRGNGFTYGWSSDNTEFVRDRAENKYKKDKPTKTPDRRYDFLAYMDNEKMQAPVSWELSVPNGSYNVRVVAGDSTKYDSIFGISVEGVV